MVLEKTCIFAQVQEVTAEKDVTTLGLGLSVSLDPWVSHAFVLIYNMNTYPINSTKIAFESYSLGLSIASKSII